jgi:hypothetical protein
MDDGGVLILRCLGSSRTDLTALLPYANIRQGCQKDWTFESFYFFGIVVWVASVTDSPFLFFAHRRTGTGADGTFINYLFALRQCSFWALLMFIFRMLVYIVLLACILASITSALTAESVDRTARSSFHTSSRQRRIARDNAFQFHMLLSTSNGIGATGILFSRFNLPRMGHLTIVCIH